MSDDVLATIAIDTTDFELGEIFAGYEPLVELTQCVPIDSDLLPYFWAENHDLDAFETEVRAADRVAPLSNDGLRHCLS